MSWSSKALSWIIPSVFSTAPHSSNVVIVSPWIDDVELLVYSWIGRDTLSGKVSLSETMMWMHLNCNIRFLVYVRTDQLSPSLNPRLSRVIDRTHSALDVRGIQHLHAKLLITNSVVLETSANLLTYSIHRNVESLNIRRNELQDSVAFAKDFVGRHG